MVKAEVVKNTDKIIVSVNGVADVTISETASIIESIVGSCIDRIGPAFGVETYFEIMARAAVFIQEEKGVDVLDDSLTIEEFKEKNNSLELLGELIKNALNAANDSDDNDFETEDDLPDFMF